jgi:CHAT domain-containing protein
MSPVCIALICAFGLMIKTAMAVTTENTPEKHIGGPDSQSHLTNETEYADSGFYRQAVDYWRETARRHRQEGDRHAEAVALFNLASTQRALGMNRRAIRSLEVALSRAKEAQSDDVPLLANIISSLAGAYLYNGHYSKAETLFVEARSKAVLLKDVRLESLILNDQANLYAFKKDYTKALDAYESAVYLADKIGAPLLAAKAQSNAALVKINQHQPQQSKRYILAALANLQKADDSHEKAQAQVKLGETSQKLLHELPDPNSFARTVAGVLNKAIRYAGEANNDRLSSYALGVLGRFYEFAEQYRDALRLTEQAVFTAQQVDAPDLLYQWQWQAGRLHKKLGNMADAIRFYRFSVQSLQPIRHELSRRNVGGAASFRETQGGVYLELADLLLQQSSLLEDRKKVSDYLTEARDSMELQKEAELQDYFKDRCVVNAKTKTKTIDEAISADTAVIYPILLPDRTELLVSYKDGMKRYTVPKGEALVTRQVRALRVKLEKRKTRDYLPYAKQLYQWLIAPMEEDFTRRTITTLVVVAGQSLRTIPLSVLHDGKNFLINKYAVASTPGLKLTDPRPLHRNLNVLVSGLSEPVQGFPALRHVRGELEEIQDLYVSELLMNRDFVTSKLSSALQDTTYSVTHIASHSVFTGDVNNSYILTYDDRITVDQLGQFAALGRDRDKPIELLTLSACQTAAGDDRAALGLAGVAVKSGARSALATLWAINDQASAILVTEFYRQLKQHVSKARALQRAQNALMQNVRYRHPGYWSPFLLIGNWM